MAHKELKYDAEARAALQAGVDGVGQGVDAALERPACVLVELELLVSHVSLFSPLSS